MPTELERWAAQRKKPASTWMRHRLGWREHDKRKEEQQLAEAARFAEELEKTKRAQEALPRLLGGVQKDDEPMKTLSAIESAEASPPAPLGPSMRDATPFRKLPSVGSWLAAPPEELPLEPASLSFAKKPSVGTWLSTVPEFGPNCEAMPTLLGSAKQAESIVTTHDTAPGQFANTAEAEAESWRNIAELCVKQLEESWAAMLLCCTSRSK
mmetsp:Transcript_56548/g.134729  ORF Transcript_56548/g.134729 Transcript_56548/m.134729 type:complete len:211 (+) Transcript_56548:67-699(+)